MAELTENQREKVEEAGWIHASIIIEVQGNDKEHIKNALENLVGRLSSEKGIEICSTKYSEIVELQPSLYSYNADVEFIARDFGRLIHVALLYSPSAVEIFAPKEMKVPIGEAQNIMVDISNIVTSLAQAVFIQQGQLQKAEGGREQGQKPLESLKTSKKTIQKPKKSK